MSAILSVQITCLFAYNESNYAVYYNNRNLETQLCAVTFLSPAESPFFGRYVAEVTVDCVVPIEMFLKLDTIV